MIPVTLLTGHLGAGKTTLLNAYLRAPGTSRTAVVINEFGDVGLDHLLVRATTENLVLLENGCICCTVRGDLIATLRDLAQRDDFDRVIVETTGLADPAPVIHSLMNDLGLMLRYRLHRVVTAVAAAPVVLDAFPEARKQVGFADALLVTKADLADPAPLEARLAALNPGAAIHRVTRGAVHPAWFEDGGFDPSGTDVAAWLKAEAFSSRFACTAETDIAGFCIRRDAALPWDVVARWLEGLAATHGPDLLRIKGLIRVREHPDGPVLVHGIQHLSHPPEMLDAWPDADRGTRVVFITRGLSPSVVEAALRAAEAALETA